MPKIYTLSPEIVAKIAAGEVIERPSYALKELIDNSIDAGASSITINIEKSGLKKIEVIDDGEGMDERDLLECFKPHTTSKISEETDLFSIKTFGFRGEALSSISAVSEVTITSRPKNSAAGLSLTIKNGVAQTSSPAAHPEGTSIKVVQLFSTVPARKKFLKSLRTEFRHILEVVVGFTLAYTQISFHLFHNNKQIFNLNKVNSLMERIQPLFGSMINENLIKLNYEESYIHIEGFIGKPQIKSRNAQNYHLFINKRSVKDKLIHAAVKEAYGTLLEPHSYPFFILFVTLPFEAVDVNVHPRKEQVAFLDSNIVYETVLKAVKETLLNHNLTFSNLNWKKDFRTSAYHKDTGVNYLRESIIPWQKRDLFSLKKSGQILQLHNLFLVAESDTGLLLIDQHAAHERILYDRLLKEFKSKKTELAPYQLQTSVRLELPLNQAEILNEYIYIFTDLGFEIDNFKDKTFLIRTIPYLFKDRPLENLIKEMLADILEKKDVGTIDSQSKKMISYLACRTAVKRGDTLTQEMAKEILSDLDSVDDNYTCPHGRPTKIEISMQELIRSFGRK